MGSLQFPLFLFLKNSHKFLYLVGLRSILFPLPPVMSFSPLKFYLRNPNNNFEDNLLGSCGCHCAPYDINISYDMSILNKKKEEASQEATRKPIVATSDRKRRCEREELNILFGILGAWGIHENSELIPCAERLY